MSALRLTTISMFLPLVTAIFADQVDWSVQDRRPVPVSDDRFTVARTAQNGDLLLFSSMTAKVQRISPQLGGVHTFVAGSIAELTGMRVNWLDDIAAGPDGSTFLPVIWRGAPRSTHFGLAVFESNGAHRRMVRLEPPVEIRHFALLPSGGFLVLGLDAGFFRGQTNQCLLLHEYSGEGARVRSFSPCPEGLDLLRPGQPQPGPGYQWLKDDVDRGKVWVQGEHVFHLLSRSRSIRVFDLAGNLARQIVMKPPEFPAPLRGAPQGSRADVWDAFITDADRIVALWSVAAEDQGRVARSRFLAVHDRMGSPLAPASLPDRQQMIVGSGGAGSCLLLERTVGGFQLLTASPRVNR